jgi:hypothetical protein
MQAWNGPAAIVTEMKWILTVPAIKKTGWAIIFVSVDLQLRV